MSEDAGLQYTLLNVLVVVNSGPHQSSPQTLGGSVADTEVQVRLIRTPEQAFVVEATDLGGQDRS